MIYEPYQLLSIGLLVTMIGTVEKREDARCVTKYQASLRAKSHTDAHSVYDFWSVFSEGQDYCRLRCKRHGRLDELPR
jgi:hypothetical protein